MSMKITSPGRVNLIGEHTDYNDGFVMPMALEFATTLSFQVRKQPISSIILKSTNLNETATVDLSQLDSANKIGGWAGYIAANASVLQQHVGQALKGFEGQVSSDVPIGAGLSSSASFSCAILRALCHVNEIDWDPIVMAKLAQKAENEYVGVNCGIMDQLICTTAQKGFAMQIDCRDLSLTPVPLPDDIAVVVMDTNTRRGLVESAYNERRMQCEQAANALGVSKLREANISDLERIKDSIDVLTYQRAKHVISENERVLQAAKAMQANDLKTLGACLNESHRSLDQDFEVTNGALNTLVAIAQAQSGCIGARMTGAGFGGCAVAFVEQNHVEAFCKTVSDEYAQKTQRQADISIHLPQAGCAINKF